jgi:hypothetical protein
VDEDAGKDTLIRESCLQRRCHLARPEPVVRSSSGRCIAFRYSPRPLHVTSAQPYNSDSVAAAHNWAGGAIPVAQRFP